MREKALVLDIDGTLTNSQKEISPATKAGIQTILKKGHKVILASGRPAPGMRRYERELELDRYGGYLISFNGAQVIECRTGKVIFRRTVPLELIPELYGFAGKNGCGLSTHVGNEAITAFAPDKYISWEAHINGMTVRQAEDFVGFVDFDVYKCLMTADPEKTPALEKELQRQFGHIASIYRSEPFFIEVMPLHVDKGDSLSKMLEIIGVKQEDVICCGDGYNDISMIKYAGVGVAMGNAQPEVKAAADYITAGNDEDGVVEVINKFILGDNSVSA